MGDIVFGAEAGNLLACYISSVVRDNSMGNSEATYYVLPEKLDNLLLATSKSGTFPIHLMK